MEKIFVYGSLLKDFWNHDRVLKNRVRSIEKGTIKGELYHLPAGYPAITSGSNLIHGEICTLTHSKHLKSIDLLEGYTGNAEIDLYTREKRMVTLQDGSVTECWVYIYMDEKYVMRKGQHIPHGNWGKFMRHNPSYR